MNQQGTCGQNYFGQPMQQDQPYGYNQQQQQNSCAPNLQPVPGNPCLCTPGIGQSQMTPCNNYLPHNILEQIRTCVGNAAPIFILPNSQPVQTQQLPQVQQSPAVPQMNMGYPSMGYPPSMPTGYPGMGSNPVFPPPCYPFPVPVPFCDAYGNHNRSQFGGNTMTCDCCKRNNNGGNNSGQTRNSGISEDVEVHRCRPGNDDTICTKPNCPASINLQALASQLLSLQGVIPCAATRLVLRKVPGSNVTTTVEDTMDRAQKSISLLNKDQLITEARNAQHVNGLINLHMTASPPQNIIPALTMLQLKVNSLKALVESLINKSVSECQSIGAEGNANLEPMILAIKSDAELRDLLATLRQKECEERVNVNYAPYHSQRVVAESRLSHFQNKINQVETEMERRRAAAMPWLQPNGQFHQESFYKGGNCRTSLQDSQFNGPHGFYPILNGSQANDASGKGFDSPSPFMVQVQSPRRLNLKPNVGGPQTTYDQSEDERVLALQVKQLEKNDEGCCKNGESWDQESAKPSKEASSRNEGKKKLKIHIDDKGELSVKKKSLEELEVGECVELSPDVVIVIDKEIQESKDQEKDQKKSKKKKKEKKKSVKKKSAESIPSDSTCGSRSETSVSSRSSDADEKPQVPRLDEKGSKSILKNIIKGKKKTSISEENLPERTSHDTPDGEHDEPECIKKEKHVNVAIMLSEICNNEYNLKKNMDSHEAEFSTFLKDKQGSKNHLEPSSATKNKSRDQHTSGSQEILDIIRENADYLDTFYDPQIRRSASSEICSIMKDASSNSMISFGVNHLMEENSSAMGQPQGILIQRDCNVEAENKLSATVKSKKPKEAQNQTASRSVRSVIVDGNEKKLQRISKSGDKENMMNPTRACFIVGKKIKTEASLEGSVSSSIGMDQRNRYNHRFK